MFYVYRVYDRASASYGRLMQAQTDADAIRALSQYCWDPNNMYHQYAEDFTLFCVGTASEDKGEVSAYESAVKVIGLWEIRDRAPARPREQYPEGVAKYETPVKDGVPQPLQRVDGKLGLVVGEGGE